MQKLGFCWCLLWGTLGPAGHASRALYITPEGVMQGCYLSRSAGHNVDPEGGWGISCAKRTYKKKDLCWRVSTLLLLRNVHTIYSTTGDTGRSCLGLYCLKENWGGRGIRGCWVRCPQARRGACPCAFMWIQVLGCRLPRRDGHLPSCAQEDSGEASLLGETAFAGGTPYALSLRVKTPVRTICNSVKK